MKNSTLRDNLKFIERQAFVLASEMASHVRDNYEKVIERIEADYEKRIHELEKELSEIKGEIT